MKKRILYALISINILIILFLIVSTIHAFLTYTDKEEIDTEMGFIDVDIVLYFEKLDENGEPQIYTEDIDFVATVGEDDSFTKFGVVKVDISNLDSVQFITNFRATIKVKSTVDTYFRVAPYEQLTYSYTIGGITREMAISQRYFMEFNYDPFNQFEDNRMFDGFYYHREKVRRNSDGSPFEITFIGTFDEEIDLKLYDPKYSLQIGFVVEAVQAHLGPERIWGLPEPPWEGVW